MIWNNEEQKKRALKNFTSFCIECKNQVFHYKTSEYKCDNCYGSGRVISPNAYNDPVEGYKMADTIVCHECNGTGNSNEKTWREFYRKEKSVYTEKVKKDREIKRIRKIALSKLTLEEKKALNIYF